MSYNIVLKHEVWKDQGLIIANHYELKSAGITKRKNGFITKILFFDSLADALSFANKHGVVWETVTEETWHSLYKAEGYHDDPIEIS